MASHPTRSLGFVCLLLGLFTSSIMASDPPGLARNKHIMFVMAIGSRSHVTPTFEIGKELQRRGHHFSYATFTNYTKYNTPGFPFHPLGHIDADLFSDATLRILNMPKGPMGLEFILGATYIPVYHELKEVLDKTTPDLLICDPFCLPCIDLAYLRDIPYVLVPTNLALFMAGGQFPYLWDTFGGQPEIRPSFVDRLTSLGDFVINILPELLALGKVLDDKRIACGVPPVKGALNARWHGRQILVTGSFFGWEQPRPLDPLVHMVGPIVTDDVRDPKPLPEDLQAWLDDSVAHNKPVILAAFGSVVPLSTEMHHNLTQALHSLIQAGRAYGAIVGANTPSPYTPTQLQEMNIKVSNWVPQPALLAHPAVQVFITHGGQESLNEGMFHGKRMVAVPIFGDQPSNAVRTQSTGVAVMLPREEFTQENLLEKITEVLMDEGGYYQGNATRVQTLMHVYSRRGVQYGADLLELEMSVGHHHLTTADKYLPWQIATNADLKAFFLLVVVVVLAVLARLLRCILPGSGRKKQKGE